MGVADGLGEPAGLGAAGGLFAGFGAGSAAADEPVEPVVGDAAAGYRPVGVVAGEQ